ncbi:helix-turn-helix domain-containing protein [Falsiroseomonas tokyonensis]|uniref:Helix-turn-helix domain-containing protein n=1 Tax=Falsiroseomonas tokyonensis TaxID=430521 RepID=A0ABV7BXQ0_9PROT|nr:helix-turn-helix domain-containing protein [Falsiroseomonas tokyonensis]MBU8540216.1 helix-turn-helix domain-containing protein [Falsiroseomonas tokyonensis]
MTEEPSPAEPCFAAGTRTGALLRRLHASIGHIVTYEALEYAIYGDSGPAAERPNFVRMILHPMIAKLRAKLPPGAIQNVAGVGYRLDPDVEGLPRIDDAHVVVASRSEEDEAAFLALAGGDPR